MRVSFRITGRVQGVGYRDYARGHARALDLAGWVRNAAEGDVEGVAEGPESALAAFRQRLHQGPPWGHVDALAWRVLDSDGPSGSESLPHPFEIHR